MWEISYFRGFKSACPTSVLQSLQPELSGCRSGRNSSILPPLLLEQEIFYGVIEVAVVESDWPAPSVQHRQFVQPSVAQAIFEHKFIGQKVQSFSHFLPLGSLQKHRPLDYLAKKKKSVMFS